MSFTRSCFPTMSAAGIATRIIAIRTQSISIVIWESGDAMRQRRRIMLEDTWEEDYFKYVDGNPLALCSRVAYRGRRKTDCRMRSGCMR